MALLALGLMGCASSGPRGSYDDGARVSALPPPPQGGGWRTLPRHTPLQCVPYVRDNSSVKIWGDAWTWWDQAAGKYARGSAPADGAVLVLHDYAGPRQGHVAVVRQIVSSREIRIDHANWLNDGTVILNNPVMDVSPANDWSQVRVFNIRTGAWGGRIYPVKGFIGSGNTPRAQPPAPPAPQPPQQEAPPSDLDILLAEIEASAPRMAAATPPVTSAPMPDLGPPAGSPYALTADDLAIP